MMTECLECCVEPQSCEKVDRADVLGAFVIMYLDDRVLEGGIYCLRGHRLNTKVTDRCFSVSSEETKESGSHSSGHFRRIARTHW
jgi:hypothetical protein